LTPCVVREKDWNKGGQRWHYDTRYVAAAVAKKAHVGMKQYSEEINPP